MQHVSHKTHRTVSVSLKLMENKILSPFALWTLQAVTTGHKHWPDAHFQRTGIWQQIQCIQ